MALLATAGWESEHMAADGELICYATPCVNSNSWHRNIARRKNRETVSYKNRTRRVYRRYIRPAFHRHFLRANESVKDLIISAEAGALCFHSAYGICPSEYVTIRFLYDPFFSFFVPACNVSFSQLCLKKLRLARQTSLCILTNQVSLYLSVKTRFIM